MSWVVSRTGWGHGLYLGGVGSWVVSWRGGVMGVVSRRGGVMGCV